MLGPGKSSAAIWTPFEAHTTASSRRPRHVLRVAWKRVQDSNLTFATVGTSVVGGTDIVQGLETTVTQPDYFDYFDETSKALRLEYDRFVEEPLGGIGLALADVVLDNTDLRFTPNQNATIGTAIVPNRPIKLDIGFQVRSQQKTIPVFKGLTETPKEDKGRRIVDIGAFDYIRHLDQFPLESEMYTNQRTDQIIKDILDTVGFSTDQYSLDTGLNTIGFAWFQAGETAGERIRRLCESEEGYFYQDGEGMLRFENRRHYSASPHGTVQWTIEPDDIISWEEDNTTEIINRCTVIANPRELGSTDEIYKHFEAEEIQHGETKTIWADFEHPVNSFTTPVATTDYQANLAEDGTSTDMTSGVSLNVTNFVKTAKIEITNSSGGTVYMTLLRLRGVPAVPQYEEPLKVVYEDSTSVSKYGRKELKVENDFIDDKSFAYYLARAMVRKYKDPKKRLRVEVRGIPHLELKDRVQVKDKDLGTYKNYRVVRIRGIMAPGEFRQILDLREITTAEADSWAIVGTTQVGSTTEFVGI